MTKEENKCVMGCTHYTGGEIKHHYDCVYYPDSLSKRFDDLQSENERLKAELLGNPEQLKADSNLTEYKLLAGEACFETLSKVNDAWPDVSDMEWIEIDPNKINQIPDEDVWTYWFNGDIEFTPKGDYIPLGTVSHYMRLVKPQPPKQ